MYPAELTIPMAKDLTDYGFESLTTAEEVDQALGKEQGTALVVVNSVCGCAAAMARPGAKLAARHENKPDHLYTVFAGVDKEATAQAREHMLPYPPSSPSIALFKDGKLVHFLERHHIEGRPAEIIAQNLTMAFDKYCAEQPA
jgi:putative YphP/YqiW family bacilliredoxin